MSMLAVALYRPFAKYASAVREARYEELFSLSDSQLATKGLSREGLVHTYFAGVAYS